jgi:hypothetical protein
MTMTWSRTGTQLLCAGILGLLIGACSGSKADELIDARRARRDMLDALYSQYGGGALAKELQTGAQSEEQKLAQQPAQEGKDAARELLKTVGNAVGEVDRVAFEEQCNTLGGGGRPVILNDKAKAFFAGDEAGERCKTVAKLSMKIAALERELGDRAPPQ